MSDDSTQGKNLPDRREDVPTTELIRRGANLPAEEWNREKVAAAMKLLPQGFRQPQHVIAYLARAQRAGLDPFLGELHAWEDRGELAFHTDIDGWVQIAKSDPEIRGVEASVIREGDDFEWERHKDGSVTVTHKGGLGGDPIGAYCVVHMMDGPDHIEIRRMEDYQHLHGKKNWKNHPSDMILIRVYEAAVSKKSTKASGIYAQDSFKMSNEGRVVGEVARQQAADATDQTEERLLGKLEEERGRDVTPPTTSGEATTETPYEPPASTPPEAEEVGSPDEDGEDSIEWVLHTEQLPDGFGIVEIVQGEGEGFWPCTVEDGAPGDRLTDQPAEQYKQAKRIVQAHADRGDLDRPTSGGGTPSQEDTSSEGPTPHDEGAVESGGMDDTPRQPCPVCGEYLKPSQMGGHKSGHTKRDETLPSDDYRVQKVGEGDDATYEWLYTGVVMETGLPNYHTALALIQKHAEPDEDAADGVSDVETPEDTGPSDESREAWQEALERVSRIMDQRGLSDEVLRDLAGRIREEAVDGNRVKLSKMSPAELRELGNLLRTYQG